MFGSLNTDTLTGKAIFLIYIFILILMVYLWIRLLTGKREAEKGTAILLFVLAAVALASLVKALIGSLNEWWVILENAIFAVVFSVIGATELIFYRKQSNEQDKSE